MLSFTSCMTLGLTSLSLYFLHCKISIMLGSISQGCYVRIKWNNTDEVLSTVPASGSDEVRFPICIPLPSALLVVLKVPTWRNPFPPWTWHSVGVDYKHAGPVWNVRQKLPQRGRTREPQVLTFLYNVNREFKDSPNPTFLCSPSLKVTQSWF